MSSYYVSSGVTSTGVTLSYNDRLYVSSGGVASDTTVNYDCYLLVSEGGTADVIHVNSRGVLEVYSGGTATNIDWTPCEGTLYIDPGAQATFAGSYTGVYYGSNDSLLGSAEVWDSSKIGDDWRVCVMNGGIATNTYVEYGDLEIYSGGVASSISMNWYGRCSVCSGGSANDATVGDRGDMIVGSGGIATSITDNGNLYVREGASADKIKVNGTLYVNSGGTATEIDWTPCVGGLSIEDGAHVTFTSEYSGVYYGEYGQSKSHAPTMENMNLASGSGMFVMAGGVANNATLSSDGRIFVSGGVANNTAVGDGGAFSVFSGGIASDVSIGSGGQAAVSSGGVITGKMTFESGAAVFAEEGAFLDFDISGLAPSNVVLANDLSCVTGTPSYSLTVSGSQTTGTYSLAKGAAGFNGAITVRSDLGLTYGTIHVGETVYAGKNSYTLNLSKGELTVTVDPPTTTNKKGDVTLTNTLPQARYMYGCGPTAVAMLLGYYDLYGYRGKNLSYLIEGDVDIKSRGTGTVKYEMSDFDSVLGRATATRDYVERFYSKDPLEAILSWNATETTPEEELPYSFVDDGEGTEIRTDEWNCIADYLGTGQFWRSNDNLSTAYECIMLEQLLYQDDTETIMDEATQIQRTIDDKYTDMLYGLYLYVEGRGYTLDRKVTGTQQVDVDGGDFTFDDYMEEIDAGRPVLVLIDDHIMTGYGYNAETREIIFDDCYNTGRMVWDGAYHYADEDRRLEAIMTVGFMTMDADIDLAVTSAISSSSGGWDEEEEGKKTYEKLILATAEDKLVSDDYCFLGSPLYVSFGVTNQGYSSSGGFEVRIYSDGEPAESLKLKSLAAGEETKRRNISLPVELGAGLHIVSISIDPDNEIQELYALNNIEERSIMVLKDGTNVVQGTKTVGAGSVSADDYVMNGAKLQVQNGGTAEGTLIQGKVTEMSSTGKVTSVAGIAEIAKGGLIRNAVVYEYGQLRISGTAEDTHVLEDGTAEVLQGGTVSGISVDGDGSLNVQSGGVLTGRIRLEKEATVDCADGATLKFDLTQAEPGNEPFLNDISLVGGSPRYTITVGNDQAEGTYMLADGAADFRNAITVTNTGGAALGTLSVGGLTVIDGLNYLLKVKKDTLTVTIGAFDPDNEPDNGWNDFLFDKKKIPSWNENIDSFPVNTVTANCELVVDEIGTVVKNGRHNMFGNDGINIDTGDVAKLDLPNAARLTFTIDSTAAGTFYVYEDGFDKSGNRAQIQIAKVAVKAGKPVELKNVGLTSYGSYYVAMTAKSVKKAGTEGLYNVSVTNTVLFVDADNADNNAAADGKVISVGRGTGAIVLDKTPMTSDTTFSNFVGFGDSIDYAKIDLAASAFVSFSFTGEGNGTAKFTIWKFDAEKNKMSKVGAVTTLTAKKAYAATTKAQFLEVKENFEYYISMECSNASKGMSVYYNVEVANNTVFFDCADDGRNNVLYNKAAKAFYSEDEDHHFVTTNVSAGTKAVKLDYNTVREPGYGNFVGHGDAADYAKIKLTTSGNLSFTLTATGDATFVVYRKTQDKKGKDKMETLQTTKLKLAKGESVVEKTTLLLAGLEAGEYCVSMTAAKTTANTKGSVFYNVSATLTQQNASSLSLPETSSAASALSMPETDALVMPMTDSLGISDAMSFGGYDADALASASTASLADLNEKSGWQSLLA